MMRWYVGIVFLFVGMTAVLTVNTSRQQQEKVDVLANNGVVEAASTESVNETGSENQVEYTARFLIYTNGTKRVFSSRKYHRQDPSVFLLADDPTIVHVTKAGTTWDDFFKTLPMTLNAQCLITGTKQRFCETQESSLRFYINGEKVHDFFERKIHSNDRVLVTYGSENQEELEKQLHEVDQLQ